MSDYSQNDPAEQEKHRKRNDLQREIIMSESDLKRVAAEKVTIEIEERKIKKEIDHLRISMQEKQKRLQVVEQDIMMREAEISHLKKQLNLL